MATFKKTLVALGGAAVLAIGMASAYADGPGDEGDTEWQAYLRSTENGGGAASGANLGVPAAFSASSPLTKCADVMAAPGNFAGNIVRYCSTHRG